jgi:hypothetical protein
MQLWKLLHPGSPALELGAGNLLLQVKDSAAAADAVVLVGNPRDESLDLDVSLAIADALASMARAIPMVRLTAVAGDAGTESEPIAVVRGRAMLRDLPEGIPIERTADALGEADRAIRLAATMRDQHCVLLRSAECVAPGRLEVLPDELASSAIHDSICGVASAHAPESATDLIDAASLASALERIVAKERRLGGSILHITGGPACRLSVREIQQQQNASAREPSPERTHSWESPRPRAHLLDDASSRRELAFSELAWAPRVLDRFRHFAMKHMSEIRFHSAEFV